MSEDSKLHAWCYKTGINPAIQSGKACVCNLCEDQGVLCFEFLGPASGVRTLICLPCLQEAAAGIQADPRYVAPIAPQPDQKCQLVPLGWEVSCRDPKAALARCGLCLKPDDCFVFVDKEDYSDDAICESCLETALKLVKHAKQDQEVPREKATG